MLSCIKACIRALLAAELGEDTLRLLRATSHSKRDMLRLATIVPHVHWGTLQATSHSKGDMLRLAVILPHVHWVTLQGHPSWRSSRALLLRKVKARSHQALVQGEPPATRMLGL